MSAASVIGRSFSFETLRSASARSEDETIDALERLTRQGFFRAPAAQDGDLSYDFSHEKLRAFVYEETSAARRSRLHARLAEALARSGGRRESAIAALIGQHYRLAGQDSAAARYFNLAGERAKALRANPEALAYFQAALASGHPAAQTLHEQIGELLTLAGAYSAAMVSYQTAAALAHPAHAPVIEHKIGGLYLRLGAWKLAEEHFTAAAEGFGQTGDQGLLARILIDLSLAAHRQEEDVEAEALAEQALQLAGAGSDRLALAQAYNIAGVLAAGRGDFAAALKHLHLSLETAEQLDDLSPRIAARNNIALVLRAQGELQAAEALTRTALELCLSQGDRHREAALRNNLADLLRAAGHPEESMAQLKSAVSIFAEIGIDGGSMEPEIWKLVEW
ncbi:MAG: tetratricopeptide repeat protein [Dehalococcoidia bacterium]|nr:tetratricopeptide repeat protein [Dehalococcoidia bacterium]